MRGPTVSSEGSISKGSGLTVEMLPGMTVSISSTVSPPSSSFEVFVSIAAGLCFRCCCFPFCCC